MAEYKNGFTPFGNKPVSKKDTDPDIISGRAVYPEDRYTSKIRSSNPYMDKLHSIENEGFHREEPPVADAEVISEPVIPEGTKSITENGLYDVRQFANADVNVEGGSGSNDFTTAEVTVINYGELNLNVYTPHLMDYAGIACVCSVEPNVPVTLTVVMYQNSSYISSIDFVSGVDGDAVIDEDEGGAFIHGNCTIAFGDDK